jgi:hypothetical protein
MAIAYFPSLTGCECVEVEFLTLSGDVHRRRLLVDTGFTGRSSFVLGSQETDLVRATMKPAPTSGALQGHQQCAWVKWRVPGLAAQRTSISFLTDLTGLSLPQGIRGMAGLTFLRNFSRWGAEQAPSGWQFFVDDGTS